MRIRVRHEEFELLTEVGRITLILPRSIPRGTEVIVSYRKRRIIARVERCERVRITDARGVSKIAFRVTLVRA